MASGDDAKDLQHRDALFAQGAFNPARQRSTRCTRERHVDQDGDAMLMAANSARKEMMEVMLPARQ